MDGYRRAALVLEGMEPQERDWFLGQLDEEDRRRISGLLQTRRDIDAPTEATATKPAATHPAAKRSATEIIEQTSLEVLKNVLAQQPSWAIALVLAHCQGSSAFESYLAQLPEAQAGQIRASVEVARGSIKPKVAALVLGHFAARIEQQARNVSKTIDFESTPTDVPNG